ncbi:MAG: SpoIID/LytB domain-containing protein [Candidatus Sumerlaeia bacterium]|nr:SpoIID/LytB domain-containing protein [Candidatus Sumerlaeia bacterium]
MRRWAALALAVLSSAAPADLIDQLRAERFRVTVRLGTAQPAQRLECSSRAVLRGDARQGLADVPAGQTVRVTVEETGQPPPVWRLLFGEFDEDDRQEARTLAGQVAGTVVREDPRDEDSDLLVIRGAWSSEGDLRQYLSRVRMASPAEPWLDGRPRREGLLAVRDESGRTVARAWGVLRLVSDDASATTQCHVNGDERRYRGSLVCVATDRGVLLVNEVPVDDYLASVLDTEIGQAPRAAMQAQAIASRSEALFNAGLSKFGSLHHDLDDTVLSQTYEGAGRETALTRAAVRSTAGIVLMHGGEIANGVYCTICGGVTGAQEDVWLSEPCAYLRARADTSEGGNAPDLSSEGAIRRFLEDPPPLMCNPEGREDYPSWARRHFRWTADYTAAELGAAAGVGRATRVQVTGRGASGRVTGLLIEGTSGEERLNRSTAIRAALSEVRSTLFVVDELPGGGFRFTGGGYGHGIGMCQMGAIQRAAAGQTPQAILGAYFPGANLRRLY